MPSPSLLLLAAFPVLAIISNLHAATPPGDLFAAPARGFVSAQPPRPGDWQQGILTGNGTMGALVMGEPFDDTVFLSHSALYLPNPNNPRFAQLDLASRLKEMQKLCLAGNFGGAAGQINTVRNAIGYDDQRDPFIGACALHIKQPEAKVNRYQRAVDFMTAETIVSVADSKGSFQRRAFASRPDGVIVLRIAGSGKQTAELSFAALPPTNDREKDIIAKGVKSSEQGVRDGLLYFRTLFANQNASNPNLGFEVAGKVIAKGGTREESVSRIKITDANEILVLIKIRPLPKKGGATTGLAELEPQLNALPSDYDKLLPPQAKVQGDLMSRVSLSLDAPATDRAKPTEQLNDESKKLDAPLAKIERAFDAGRYNIICATGHYPPNLQGLWSATWVAPWSGSFTTNGNLPTAIAFLLMGNTPELMKGYFRYYDERWPGFREDAKVFFGTRGFHVPAQLTLSPLATDFNPNYPHCFSQAGAPWALEFYYDYYRYTGDKKFLAERAYPLMKEAAAFYEDFLTVKDKNGKLVFVPSFSPENGPGGERKVKTAINATMDVSAAKQLLGNAIAAARTLGVDANLQKKWGGIIAQLPPYEVAADGSFREWLWPGLPESPEHRHASQLYALYDEMPAEIVKDPQLVKAIEQTIDAKIKWRASVHCGMAFGAVQIGLAAAHIGNARLTQDVINMLAKYFWTYGMASDHDWGNLFNMDISGGFPYLCASALVYADPGRIQFFPARPPQWKSGSLKGVRLRGGIVVTELTWNGPKAKAVLVSDTDQTVTIESPDRKPRTGTLQAGVPTTLDL